MLVKNLIFNWRSKRNLRRALQIAKENKENSFFVFDLDSTLFCMKYRTGAIIQNTCKDPVFSKKFAKHLDSVRLARPTETDWSLEEIMSRQGLVAESEVVRELVRFWRRDFFSNDYLHLDQPYEGAVDFVQQIAGFKAQIYYLTARRRDKMLEGSLKSLREWNFPLQKEDDLIMKINPQDSDAYYKTEWLKGLSKKTKTLCFFDNEPVILNKVKREIPSIQLFWMDSTHSRKEKAPREAHVISMRYSF